MIGNVDELSAIISTYRKSTIQSEAEVRSKLLVPFIEWLGYPPELRAEEFPVYGWGGSRRLPSKPADFILFDDIDFAIHRNRSTSEMEWVYNHSLLIVEAKKPGKIDPDEANGQARFYTQWTRGIAYIVCDGEIIKCYSSNEQAGDYLVIDCRIDDLPQKIGSLHNFSYDYLEGKKEEVRYHSPMDILLQDGEKVSVVTKESIDQVDERAFELSPERRDYFKKAVHPSGYISDKELVKRFMILTDAYLDTDSRWGIPQYMYDIPRISRRAKVFVNKDVFSTVDGELTWYYWGKYDRYIFSNDYVDIFYEQQNKKLHDFWIQYHVYDYSASLREQNLSKVKSLFDASQIVIEDEESEILKIKYTKIAFEHNKVTGSMVDFFIEAMQMIQAIETEYGIHFVMDDIKYGGEVKNLHNAICIVFDGVVGKSNCTKRVKGGSLNYDLVLNDNIFIAEGDIDLPEQQIYQYTFEPRRTMFVPQTIKFKGTTEKDIINAECCCSYDIVAPKYIKPKQVLEAEGQHSEDVVR